MAEKVTKMVLNVNPQCCRCYKKVKKVLTKFPQIRAQIYDEKANTVTIDVVCCSPEKIRDKLCCKGGGSIESIEIIPPPPKPKPDPKPNPQPTPPPPIPPVTLCCMVCYHGHGGGPCYYCGPPPPSCYATYGWTVYDSWGGGGCSIL